uniref:Nucleolar protein 9 n=1 Tax=Glossina morsitans morsitans TaxID=37546 RepID=A0A1B0G1H5_GLOMM
MFSGSVNSGKKSFPTRQKRKNKNTRFRRNAHGFAKKGIFGRGTQIDEEQFSYFVNILDAMKSGFESVEDKVTMANNVLAQTKDQEVRLSSNQIVCKVLESLLGFVEAERLESYFQAFAENFRPLCSDSFASHILQKLVEIAFLRFIDGESPDVSDHSANKKSKLDSEQFTDEFYNRNNTFSEDHKRNCANFVLKTSKFLLNNLEDFVWDSCANHIMRTCVLSLAGIYEPKKAFSQSKMVDIDNRKIYSGMPSEWHETCKEFAERLQMWPQFPDLPYQEHSSALIGTICIALKVLDKKMLKLFGKQLLLEAFLKHEKEDKDESKDAELSNAVYGETDQEGTPKDLSKAPKVFQHQSSVRLLETLLVVAGPILRSQIYNTLFAGRVHILAEKSLTNFSVQKLLQCIKEKEDFESVFEELKESIENLLKIGHTGVVKALTAACLRLQTKQAQMITALQNALHVHPSTGVANEKSKFFFLCLLKLKPYEIVKDDESSFVHLHGSMIIQNLLQFNKPIFIVNCIIESPPEKLVSCFTTPNGSYIAEAFLQSKFIGEKSREKLIRLLEGFYVELAISKHGSHVLEMCFAKAQDNYKIVIVKELAEKANMVKGSQSGRVVYSKLRVDTYRSSVNQWKNSLQQKQPKAQQLFKNLIDE